MRRRYLRSELPRHRLAVSVQRQFWAQVLEHVFGYLQLVMIVLSYNEPPLFGFYFSSSCFTGLVLQFQ
ncbi:hypothetical protein SAMN04488144_14027 [Methylobacterium sp. 190mf]|nr:hypothetical protein SAMN04488144_14027 [Methylobacterium sp. 190mf]